MFRDDFMEVFLMTHSCFTTPKEVLTALLNCIKSPDDTWSDSSSQVCVGREGVRLCVGGKGCDCVCWGRGVTVCGTVYRG